MSQDSDSWRRLALQFDEHRMMAKHHIQMMLIDPELHAEKAREFLNAAPLSGEKVLANRIQALAGSQPKLTVWYGSMPESNGKKNWTALLHRAGESMMGAELHTIDRSEYPDRVRYAADCVRYIIGELDEKPFILDYDADKYDGLVIPDAPDLNEANLQKLWELANGCHIKYARLIQEFQAGELIL